MNFVKWKATTKSKLAVRNYDEVKQQLSVDIKAAVEMAEIPHDLILNWVQTGIKYIPVSEWTMDQEESKRVEISRIEERRQIIAILLEVYQENFFQFSLFIKEPPLNACHLLLFQKNGTSQLHIIIGAMKIQ